MKLNFDIEITLNDKKKVKFAHEPNNVFVGYFQDGDYLRNVSDSPSYGQYTNSFDVESQRITSRSIVDFGIKSFPKLGAYGYFTPKYGDGNSKILIPINKEGSKSLAPSVEIQEVSANSFRIIFTNPEDVEYEAYRLILGSGGLMTEYVTYDKVTLIYIADGSYELLVRGYNLEEDVISELSFVNNIVISGGNLQI